MTAFRLMVGDALEQLRTLPDACVQTCVTSPPYWGLRDYGVEGQIGLEPTSGEFIGRLLEVFREVRRVLRPDGTAWVNLGDTYASAGTGTTGVVALVEGRRFIGCELNPAYAEMAEKRSRTITPSLFLGAS